MINVTFEDNFDFEKTYTEYGFDVKNNDITGLPNCIDKILDVFFGVTQVHFLHNYIVVHSKHFGINIKGLNEIKEKMGAEDVNVAIISPYLKTDENNRGLFYNIRYAKNCTPPKYPIERVIITNNETNI